MNMKNIKLSYVYILICSDDTLYTGWTTNILARTKTHNSGKGAKYTRGRTPIRIAHLESFSNKIDAQRREYRIKKLTKAQKLNLIKNKNTIN